MLPDRDALVVGMTVVPVLFSRNRNFALFTDPEMKRARARAGQLRGALKHLREPGIEVVEFARQGSGHGGGVLAYRIREMRLFRRMDLSPTEAACLAYLAARVGIHVLSSHDGDRAVVDAALARLSMGIALPPTVAVDPL